MCVHHGTVTKKNWKTIKKTASISISIVNCEQQPNKQSQRFKHTHHLLIEESMFNVYKVHQTILEWRTFCATVKAKINKELQFVTMFTDLMIAWLRYTKINANVFHWETEKYTDRVKSSFFRFVFVLVFKSHNRLYINFGSSILRHLMYLCVCVNVWNLKKWKYNWYIFYAKCSLDSLTLHIHLYDDSPAVYERIFKNLYRW